MTDTLPFPGAAVSRAGGPTFVGIGGQKCASTWLAECLAAHPEVFVHPKKEIKYFNRQTQEGEANVDAAQPLDWYRDHFAGPSAQAAAVRGEFTPDYLFDGTAAARMREALGPVQILCVFRDPVARLRSHLRHIVRRGLVAVDVNRPIDAAELRGLIAEYPTLKSNGFYFDALGPFLDSFGRDRVHISISERLTAGGADEMARVFAFLGVDADFVPPMLTQVVGGGYVPKSRAAEAGRIAVFNALHKFAPAALPMLRATGLPQLYKRLNGRPTAIRFAPDAEALLRELYAPTAAGLESLGVLTPGEWSCSPEPTASRVAA